MQGNNSKALTTRQRPQKRDQDYEKHQGGPRGPLHHADELEDGLLLLFFSVWSCCWTSVPSCPPQALRLTTQTRSNNKTTLPRLFAGTSPPGDIHIIGMVGSRSPWKVEVSLLIFFCSVWAVGQSARRGGQFPTRYPRPIKPTRVNNNDKKIRINKGRRVPRAPTDVT